MESKLFNYLLLRNVVVNTATLVFVHNMDKSEDEQDNRIAQKVTWTFALLGAGFGAFKIFAATHGWQIFKRTSKPTFLRNIEGDLKAIDMNSSFKSIVLLDIASSAGSLGLLLGGGVIGLSYILEGLGTPFGSLVVRWGASLLLGLSSGQFFGELGGTLASLLLKARPSA